MEGTLQDSNIEVCPVKNNLVGAYIEVKGDVGSGLFLFEVLEGNNLSGTRLSHPFALTNSYYIYLEL